MADSPGDGGHEQPGSAATGGISANAKPSTDPTPFRPNSPRALREAEEDRIRQRQNILAGLFVIGLLAAGYWLINAMADAQKLEMCLLAHHRNCGPVDTTPPQ